MSSTWLPFISYTATFGMSDPPFPSKTSLALYGRLDDDIAVPRSRHRTLDQEQVPLGVHLDHLQVLDGHAFASHASGEGLTLKHASRIDRPEGAGSPMILRAVAHRSAGLIVPLDRASKALPLRCGGNIHHFAFGEQVDLHFLTQFILRRIHPANLADKAFRRRPGLFGMADFRTVRPMFLLVFKTELNGFVPVRRFFFLLENDTGARSNHRYRHRRALGVKDLCHPQLLAENPLHLKHLLTAWVASASII